LKSETIQTTSVIKRIKIYIEETIRHPNISTWEEGKRALKQKITSF